MTTRVAGAVGLPEEGSLVHRAPAHLKVLALVGLMVVVVATPAGACAAFALYAALLAAVVETSRVPVLRLARRMVVEVPFVVFALMLSFVARGPRAWRCWASR